MFLIKLIISIVFTLITTLPAAAKNLYQFPQGEVELFIGKDKLAIHFRLIPEWHTYWKNSGDSGAAPVLQFEDINFKTLQTLWSFPKRIPTETLINFGYEKESLLVIPYQPPLQDLQGRINLEFLVCKVECIPYLTSFDLAQKKQLDKTENLVRQFQFSSLPSKSIHLYLTSITQDKAEYFLDLNQNPDQTVNRIEFFPIDGTYFQSSEPTIEKTQEGFKVSIKTTTTDQKKLSESAFLIGLFKDDILVQSFELLPSETEKNSLLFALAAALIGGLILNLMPCVFPVLSIKALSLLQQTQNPALAKKNGWLYTLGVCSSFFLLGLILLILRLAGEQIGWGFQMQNPWMIAILATLFFWLSLNFIGAFEFDFSISLSPQKTTSSGLNSFVTGVLATAVATPCTAPFMGTALGASLTMPAHISLLIFTFLGLGMSLPFLLLGYAPKLFHFLPRPGAWMITFRKFLAFPLLITTLWLLWVLSLQAGLSATFFLLANFILIYFLLWLHSLFKSERKKRLTLFLGAIVSFLMVLFIPINKQVDSNSQSIWKSFDLNKIDNDLKKGQSVFIDFTAAWCITCQVNKRAVLRTPEIENHFKKLNVSLYVADWTDKNPVIAQELAKYGRNSLPLYVFLKNAQSKPQLLSELLTKEMIYQTINSLEEK